MVEELEHSTAIVNMFGGIGGEHGDVEGSPVTRNKEERDNARFFEERGDAY
jgi:hypothetical protein